MLGMKYRGYCTFNISFNSVLFLNLIEWRTVKISVLFEISFQTCSKFSNMKLFSSLQSGSCCKTGQTESFFEFERTHTIKKQTFIKKNINCSIQRIATLHKGIICLLLNKTQSSQLNGALESRICSKETKEHITKHTEVNAEEHYDQSQSWSSPQKKCLTNHQKNDTPSTLQKLGWFE